MVVSPLALERPFCLHVHFGTPSRVDPAADVDCWNDPEDDHSVGPVSQAEEGVLYSPDFPAAVAVFAFSHHLEGDVRLCPIFVDIVGRTVDREIRSFPGDLGHSSRSVGHTRCAAENRRLAYSLVADVVGEGSPDHTVRVRSHCSRRYRRSIGRPVDLHRIHSLHILRVDVGGDHSPGRDVDRSCRIVVGGGSQYSVGAPEPAGAGRSSPDEEHGIEESDCRPCCQSNGR